MWINGVFMDENSDAGATTGEATPAASTPAADALPAESPATEVDLSEIIDSDLQNDADGGAPAPAPVSPSVAKPPVAPASPAAAAPTPTSPATPAPAATPAPTATPVATPTATPPVAPAEPTAPDFAALRSQQAERLATAYALSEEDARTMLVEPEKVIPKLAAQLHLDVFEATVNAIVSALPRIIESQTQQRTARELAKQEFYTEFPALEDSKFERQVETAIVMYKQLNPQATRAQAIAAAGVQVSLANQIPLPTKFMSGLSAPAEPTQQRSASFTPAGAGAPASTPGFVNPNYFTKIAEEDVLDR